jgi:hypothetical protein
MNHLVMSPTSLSEKKSSPQKIYLLTNQPKHANIITTKLPKNTNNMPHNVPVKHLFLREQNSRQTNTIYIFQIKKNVKETLLQRLKFEFVD